METNRDREHLRAGARSGPHDSAEIRRYYEDLLPEVAPSLEERVEWLLQEVLRLRADYAGTCHFAWNLYLAGTGQTNETFRGLGRDPIEEVRQAVALVAAGVLTPPTEKGNVSDDTPAPRRNDT